MKNYIGILTLFFFASPFSQGINREVLYTLGRNEVVVEGEANILCDVKQRNFAMITFDTLSNNYRFIWNGSVVYEGDYVELSYLNLNEENGYALRYNVGEKVWMNFRGKLLGPYESGGVLRCIGGGDPALIYRLGTKYYAIVGAKKYGPMMTFPNNLEIQEKESNGLLSSNFYSLWAENLAYCKEYLTAIISGGNILEAESSTLYFNGQVKNTYDSKRGSIGRVAYVSPSNFGFVAYYNSDPYHTEVWINGKSSIFKGYNRGFIMNKSDYFLALSNDRMSVLKNGQPYLGPIDELLDYSNNGDFMYRVNNDVYVNQKRIATCQGFVVGAYVRNDKSYVFGCQEEATNKVVVSDATGVKGTYDYANGFKLDGNGALTFNFFNQTRPYVQKPNGSIANGSLDFSSSFYTVDLRSEDGNHSFESNMEYNYVVVDGEMFGSAPALQAWYEKSNNSFQWTAIENNQFVLFAKSFR